MNTYAQCIVENQVQSVSTIPFHLDVPGVQRWTAPGFPLHVAIHQVTQVQDLPNDLVQPHQHAVPELNILMSPTNNLEYNIQLGDEQYLVQAPCTIWVPAGVMHAANVVRGSGYFVCVILDSTANVFGQGVDTTAYESRTSSLRPPSTL